MPGGGADGQARPRHLWRSNPVSSTATSRSRLIPAPGRAAEAARCAQRARKFWLSITTACSRDPKKLGDADLKQTAVDLGLDAAKFNACFDSHKVPSRLSTATRKPGATRE